MACKENLCASLAFWAWQKIAPPLSLLKLLKNTPWNLFKYDEMNCFGKRIVFCSKNQVANVTKLLDLYLNL